MPVELRGGSRRRIGLIGCVKKKASGRRAARDLYESPLFKARLRYVERTCREWWILSAKHGLVHPATVLVPYDLTLKTASRSERRDWTARVLAAIKEQIRPVGGDTFEIHAGSEYREFGLRDGLEADGLVVEVPTAGMGIGRQLRFYRDLAG